MAVVLAVVLARSCSNASISSTVDMSGFGPLARFTLLPPVTLTDAEDTLVACSDGTAEVCGELATVDVGVVVVEADNCAAPAVEEDDDDVVVVDDDKAVVV